MWMYSNDIPFEHIRINSGMVIIRNNMPELNSQFLFFTLRDYIFSVEYKKVVSGSAQPQLPIKDLKKFHLLLLPLPEQSQIIEILDAHDTRIRTEQAYLEKLKKQKQGLMQDLLTGKVRVPLEE